MIARVSLFPAVLLGPSLLARGGWSRPNAPARTAWSDHGLVEWFGGSFDQALAEAAKRKRLVLLDFWAKSCPFCKILDRETLSDATVVEEARGFVCLPIDVESADGRPIAARYGITSWPALVFLETDGTLRDRLAGLLGPEQLVSEFHRVHSGLGTFGEVERKVAANPKDVVARLDLVLRLRNLHDERWAREMAVAREGIERGEGFDPKSPEDRFAIARRLRQCHDEPGYQKQISAIRTLDPEGRTAPLRHLALADLLEELNARILKDGEFDSLPVRSFLANERHGEVRFEGWFSLHEIAMRHARWLDRRGGAPTAVCLRKEAQECARETWKSCPPESTAEFGRVIASNYIAMAQDLTEEDRAFALSLATKASEAAPQSVDHLETLAACFELAGRRAEAVAVLERARAIEPTRTSIRSRLEELRR